MARHELSAHERRGIEYQILAHDEARSGARPGRPHLRIPVTITAGDRVVDVGDVPALTGLPGEVPALLVDELEANVRKVVESWATTITQYQDVFRLLEHRDELRQAVARDVAGELGPVIGLLRERAGLSKTALARQIGHHRQTQAAWEAGGPTQANIGTLHRAAAALGYSSAAIVMAVDALDHRPVSVA